MTRSTPAIRDAILLFADEEIAIPVDTAQWFAWLEEEGSTIFSFHTSGTSYTARKERAGNHRGSKYWKAYRKHQGKLYRAYIGKPEDLTLERLNAIAQLLETRIHSRTRKLPPSHNGAGQPGQAALYPPLLETKLHPPQISASLIERARLLQRLKSSLAHKITLLQAPAGFGKTTLVNQWLSEQAPHEQALAWVSLDPEDNDLLRFWHYVIISCQAFLKQEQSSPSMSALEFLGAGPRPPFEASPVEMALTGLLNDLAEAPFRGLLILDDYHLITEARIHETLTFLIDHLPPQMHILLLSRSEPPLPLLRWRARGDLSELHGSDLRFSLDETRHFLHQMLPTTISEQALAHLDSSLEGWAAGLRLISLTLSRWQTTQAIEQALISLGEQHDLLAPHRPLLDYFVTEILETQPEPLQRFLLLTSTLNRLCGPLCATITGNDRSAELIEAIKRAGLFLEVLEGPGEWYRYHALFAEAMRREASKRLGEEALQEASLLASSWYEQENFLLEAIEAARLGQDMQRMARLIEATSLRKDFYGHPMLRWLSLLPAKVLDMHPSLCLLLAVELRFPAEVRVPQEGNPISAIEHPSEVQRMYIEELLHKAEQGWREQKMEPWIGSLWAFRLLSDHIDQRPFSTLVQHAQRGLALLPEVTHEYSLKMWRSTCLLYVGVEHLHMGRIGEAQQHLAEAQRCNVAPLYTYLTTVIGSAQGKLCLLQGELHRAERYHLQALAEARKFHDYEMVSDALLELAWLSFEAHDLTRAEEWAREAWEMARRVPHIEREFIDRAGLQLALIQHARGETIAALQQVTALLAKPGGTWSPNVLWLRPRLHEWQIRLLIVLGELQTAREELDLLDRAAEQSTLTEELSREILRGRLLLAQGEEKAALQHFVRLLLKARELLHHYHALEIQLLLALAHSACKQEQQAHYWLRQTLLQVAHEGYIRLFLSEGKPMLQLLHAVLPDLQHDVALRSHAQRILRAASERPNPSRSISTESLLMEALSSQEERVLRLLADGRTNQEIARELFVSVNTVKYHIKHLYQKLGVNNRLQASKAARALHIVPTH